MGQNREGKDERPVCRASGPQWSRSGLQLSAKAVCDQGKASRIVRGLRESVIVVLRIWKTFRANGRRKATGLMRDRWGQRVKDSDYMPYPPLNPPNFVH